VWLLSVPLAQCATEFLLHLARSSKSSGYKKDVARSDLALLTYHLILFVVDTYSRDLREAAAAHLEQKIEICIRKLKLGYSNISGI